MAESDSTGKAVRSESPYNMVDGNADVNSVTESQASLLASVMAGSDVPKLDETAKMSELVKKLGRLVDALGGVVPLAPHERGEEDDNEDTRICTADNWKSFLPCEALDREGHTIGRLELAEFDQKEMRPLYLSEVAGNMRFEIMSAYLQKQFRKIIDIQYHYGVALLASAVIISSPFAPFYHHLEELKANIADDSEISRADRNYFNAVYSFFTLGSARKRFEDIRNLVEEGFIIYSDLWALYKPGDLVVSKDPVGNYELAQVTSVKWEEDIWTSIRRNRWFITTVQMDYSAGKFQKVSRRRRVEEFAGPMRIKELDFYPLSHYPSMAELKATALQRGKDWKSLCEAGPQIMSYQGRALSLFKQERQDYRLDVYSPPDYNTVALSSTVIVDSDARSKLTKQANIDGLPLLEHPLLFPRDSGTRTDFLASDFAEQDYLTSPANIAVFSIDDQDWYSVSMASLQEKKWSPTAFDRLVLDADTKSTLKHLARTNIQPAERTADVIEGKGRGIVMLLHGPPGVGKTLTAEVLSEVTKRPLLKVNLGRISNHNKWEQSLEQIFFNAEAWNAILLIDEAEIVLEKRTFKRMTQHSWISAFLRKLEYYRGILILTTNLISHIDEAFESRISFPIYFPPLTAANRRQIWTDFLNDVRMPDEAARSAVMGEIGRWAELDINGRQIRNVILMAEKLALDEEGPRLTPAVVDGVLRTTLKFHEFNRENKAAVEKY